MANKINNLLLVALQCKKLLKYFAQFNLVNGKLEGWDRLFSGFKKVFLTIWSVSL